MPPPSDATALYRDVENMRHFMEMKPACENLENEGDGKGCSAL
jgi:hypothetical protein